MTQTEAGAAGRLPRRAGFAAVAVALALVFLASGTPIPLYNTFRVEDGITDGDLAITTVAYLGVTALSLLVLGRLSNHLGRKPVALAAVFAAIAGLVVLMTVHGLPALMSGRILQGIACGIASSALGSWAIDLAPARPSWLPALVTGALPPFVLPAGALVSGALTEYAPLARLLTFILVAAALVLLVPLLAAAPETMPRTRGALRSLVPRVHVPTGRGLLLFAVGAALVATWSFSGFYQAFSPSITADHLGTSNRLVIAVVFSSIVILSPVGGLLAARLRRPNAVRIGLTVFALAAASAVVALHTGGIGTFLAASYAAGIAQGMVATGGMGSLLDGAAPGERAGLLASTYLISYGGAAIPGLISGRLAGVLDLPDIAIGYVALIVIAGGAALVALTRSGTRTDSDAPSHP